MRRTTFILVFVLLAVCRLQAAESDSLRALSGPYQYRGLTFYLVERPDAIAHTYVTLEEALSNGSAVIHERNSQTLWIDNLGTADLFVQSGDLIKGGQQDRMVASDLIVPAHDTSQDLQVYCIEHDRSTKRGEEPLDHFSSSHEIAPLHHLRITAKNALTSELLTPKVGGITAPDAEQLALLRTLGNLQGTSVLEDAVQQSVWHDVASVQSSLTQSVGDNVTKNESPSSLQLSLENASLVKARNAYVRKFKSIVEDELRSIGVVYAINGKIVGTDEYASHDLFLRMWPKLLRAIVTESLQTPTSDATLSVEDVRAYLDQSMSGKTATQEPNARTRITAKQSQATLMFETFDKAHADAGVHTCYLSK